MQWVTSVSHAQIVENQNIATATLLRWSKFETTFLLLILHELSISSYKNKKLDLNIPVEIKLSYLNGLSRYQEKLIRHIEELREKS